MEAFYLFILLVILLLQIYQIKRIDLKPEEKVGNSEQQLLILDKLFFDLHLTWTHS